MPRIAEKLEFMKVRAVTVCVRAGIGRKVGYEKRVFMHIFSKNCLGKENSWPFKVNIVRLLMSYGENNVC